jgi:hypothetical protein
MMRATEEVEDETICTMRKSCSENMIWKEGLEVDWDVAVDEDQN